MFSKNLQKFPSNRRSIRTRFAHKFLRALKKLNQKRTSTRTSSSSSSSLQAYNRRCHMVKMAAHASLASAVGSRRAWSRALVWKIRNRGLNRSLEKQTRTARALRERISSSKENPNREFDLDGLRRLVPGGQIMDTLSLFDETAHYIKCLTIQVQMMRKFVHVYSG